MSAVLRTPYDESERCANLNATQRRPTSLSNSAKNFSCIIMIFAGSVLRILRQTHSIDSPLQRSSTVLVEASIQITTHYAALQLLLDFFLVLKLIRKKTYVGLKLTLFSLTFSTFSFRSLVIFSNSSSRFSIHRGLRRKN